MPGAIKGITIEFQGDTTKLDKALRQVNNETKAIDKELRAVNNSLKFNPKNVDLLRQKQTLLTKKVEETTKKLDLLKQAQKKMDSEGVDKNSAEYRELQREIIKAENQQKAYNAELRKVKAASSALGQAATKMKEFGSKAEAAGKAMAPISAAAGAVDIALAGLAYKSGKAADELNTLSKVTGIGTADLQKYKAASDLVDVSVETIAKSQTKMKRSMFQAQQAIEKATDETGELDEVSGAAALAFEKLGVSVTDSNGELRSQDDVFNDVIAALGKMKNETERDALAMQIFGKSATELNPLIEDGGETYKRVAEIFKNNNLEIVDQETLDQANAFNDQIDIIKTTATVALQTVGSKLAGYLAPMMEKVADLIAKVASWLSQLDPEVLAIIGTIAAVVAAVAPVLIIVGKVATGISAIMSLVSTIGPALAGLAGPIGIVIAVIAGLIAAGVAVYKNWDKIKEKAGEIKDWVVEKWTALKNSVVELFSGIKTGVISLWEGLKAGVKRIALEITLWTLQKFFALRDKIKSAFESIKTTAINIWTAIKTAITHPIETAVGLIKKAIDKIKSIINGAKLSLPKFKLPHFKIDGGEIPWGIGGAGRKPSINVEWYKRGAIFNKPTIAGLGEAGPEAIIPLDKLWNKMDEIVAAGSGGGDIVVNVYGSGNMNEAKLVSEIKRQLIAEVKNKRLAWG